MFSQNIVWYLFFTGAGSGLAAVVFFVDSFLRRFRPLVFCNYQHLIAPGLALGMVLVAVGLVFLVFDSVRVDRILELFTHPSLSALSIGAWSLVLFLGVTALQLLVRLRFAARTPQSVHIALRWLGAACALAVMLYTGILLQSLRAVHFWASPLLPVLFVLSSLSSGVALLLMLGFYRRGDAVPLRAYIRLSTAHLPLLLAELAVLAGYLALMAQGTPVAQGAVDALLKGEYAQPFWMGVVALGLLVPVGIELASRRKGGWSHLMLSGGALLLGALALRFCILGVGAHPDSLLTVLAIK